MMLFLNHIFRCNQILFHTYLGSVMRINSLANLPTNVMDWLSVGGNIGTGIALLWCTLCHSITFTLRKLLHSMSILKPITRHNSSYNQWFPGPSGDFLLFYYTTNIPYLGKTDFTKTSLSNMNMLYIWNI